ncbi:fumarylacetoacetate hydrolase family protein [Barnesiella sp. An55]|uniref:fumarylacetoacetate hydrolase family protein n=1 Tax=Barnesiella sp. An55 TaxID=1965646 RepID=UPI000B393ED1|nr:fumarylacetoacetate hydrolase family protein [Barnesiella sp. An55]OUN72608.1 2-hydroxyhepta-2,4-diene-1,7-dioate isomerase [Barnesiella sp. An55]HIZ26720.1 fumarylacetoacetate hydrolase family protein [Candidatus Barnesiella merdipullorum]
MKIIAVGWNYQSHNAEMAQKELPKVPVVFTMPETSLLKDGKPFFLPNFSNRIEYETELVFHVSRLGKNIAPKFAHRYYDAVTVGIDFTARDIQAEARRAGNPWDISKGFDYSAPIGRFLPLPELPPKADNITFSMSINGTQVQQGNSSDMIFPIDQIIAYVSQFYTLKIGDIIFTGTPAGVGPVKIGDHIEGFIGNTQVLDFFVK